MRTETEDRWERLIAANRRLDDRVRQLERALSGLRSKAALLDRLNEIDELMSAIRADAANGRRELGS